MVVLSVRPARIESVAMLHQGGIQKEVAVLFECPAINAEELGQGIEDDQRISTFWIPHHLGSEVHGSDGTSLPARHKIRGKNGLAESIKER